MIDSEEQQTTAPVVVLLSKEAEKEWLAEHRAWYAQQERHFAATQRENSEWREEWRRRCDRVEEQNRLIIRLLEQLVNHP